MFRLATRSWPLIGWCTLIGCSPQTREAPPRGADKASLFGDPTLVPTRDGEAARREIALAGEVALALRATGWIDDVRVDVEQREVMHVLVAGRIAAHAPSDLEARVRAVVASVCSNDTALTIVLAEPPPRSAEMVTPAPTRRLDLPLGLALFGLGASVGLTADRTWRRQRRKRS